ncbi:MAG: ABC-2 family transporter protein [Deltaproteobacteria bacterium]|nr:ABC-2 family transporter protein [Deltaproteobacteria bacterium]
MSFRSDLGRAARAFPTMLRVGFAEVVAYRAEFFVWVLAYTMPLIMLALWTAVAREAPVGRFGEAEFSAYFLASLLVRLGTASWVVWQLNMEIRQGSLAQRLLRPIHPVLAYASESLAAIPMRILVASPIALASLWWLGLGAVTHEPELWLVIVFALFGTWALNFLVMTFIGSLGFLFESSLAIFDVWVGLYMVLSGYVMPLELFPASMLPVVEVLPFRFMLAFPVEAMTGLLTAERAWSLLLGQFVWILAFLGLTLLSWSRGIKKFAAFGG